MHSLCLAPQKRPLTAEIGSVEDKFSDLKKRITNLQVFTSACCCALCPALPCPFPALLPLPRDCVGRPVIRFAMPCVTVEVL